MSDYSISVVIPTKDRQADLMNCVDSIGAQTHSPNELIVVNDGELTDETTASLRKSLPSDTDFHITSSDGSPSTSTARNTGARLASSDVVLILDDDVVLGETYIERLRQSYREFDSPDLAGIFGFDDRNPSNESLPVRIFNVIFRTAHLQWKINPVGMHSQNNNISEPERSDWPSGHNASFKRDVLLDEPFAHWSGGREALEDVEFGWRLKNKGYHFVVDPRLELSHHHSEKNRDPKLIGINKGRNRVRIFRKHGSGSLIPLFVWAEIGEVLKHLLAPLFGNDLRNSWLLGFGLLWGLLTEATGASR